MMARKSFWQRLFGGGDDPPEDQPKKQPADHPPTDPETPAAETGPDLPTYPQHETPQPHAPKPDADDTPAPEDDDTADRIQIETGPPPDSPEPPEPPEPPEGASQAAVASVTFDEAKDEPPDPAPETPVQSETTLPQTAELKTDAVGRVYAQSLLELAQDAGQTDAIAQEVAALLPLVEPGGDLHRLVTNPAISTDERSKIVAGIFEGKVSDLLYRFLQVVTSKNRLGSLDTILGGYLIEVSVHRGLVNVDAYVATPMDDATAARVAEQIGQSLGKEVTLRQHVDESLIGGLKIQVGDKLIDASVASQLRSMKQKMMAGRG